MKYFNIFFTLFLICFSSSNLLSLQHFENSSFSSHQTSGEKLTTYLKEGEIAKQNGDFQKALELFEKENFEAKKEKDEKREIYSLIKLALIYWNIGKVNISKTKYTEALDIAREKNFKEFQDHCVTILEIFKHYSDGKNFRHSGKYTESIESFNNAVNLAKKLGSKEHELKCLRLMSFVYLEDNKLQNFALLNENGLELARELNHRSEEGKCLINLGFFFQKIDNYHKALNYYENALDISTKINNKNDISACLNNIGNIYRSIGEFEKSLSYSLKALKIDREIGNEIYICIDLNNIGITYKFLGNQSEQYLNYQNAINYYSEALTGV